MRKFVVTLVVNACVLYSQVLEMVATAAPEVFTDWKRQSAELHIARLFQVNIQKKHTEAVSPRLVVRANYSKVSKFVALNLPKHDHLSGLVLSLLRFSFKVNFEILSFRPAAGLKVLKQLVQVVFVCLLLLLLFFFSFFLSFFMMCNMSLKLEEISKQGFINIENCHLGDMKGR